MTSSEFLLIAGMAIVTFAARYPVLAIFSRLSLPAALLDGLKFIPPAVLTAIIVPTILIPNGDTPNLSPSNDYLVAGFITTFIAWRTKNLLLTLAIGMAALWGWRLLLVLSAL